MRNARVRPFTSALPASWPRSFWNTCCCGPQLREQLVQPLRRQPALLNKMVIVGRGATAGQQRPAQHLALGRHRHRLGGPAVRATAHRQHAPHEGAAAGVPNGKGWPGLARGHPARCPPLRHPATSRPSGLLPWAQLAPSGDSGEAKGKVRPPHRVVGIGLMALRRERAKGIGKVARAQHPAPLGDGLGPGAGAQLIAHRQRAPGRVVAAGQALLATSRAAVAKADLVGRKGQIAPAVDGRGPGHPARKFECPVA